MAKVRSEISENLKWDLSGIFKSDEDFKVALKNVEKKLDFSK